MKNFVSFGLLLNLRSNIRRRENCENDPKHRYGADGHI
jgi:hypothetical protein